jgi:hypothetical protein
MRICSLASIENCWTRPSYAHSMRFIVVVLHCFKNHTNPLCFSFSLTPLASFHSLCTMHLSITFYTLHLAPVPCTLHLQLAPCTSISQLQVVQSGLSAPDGHQDPLCTPRRHNVHDRDASRNVSSSCCHCNTSHLHFPVKRTLQHPSSPPYHQNQSSLKAWLFLPAQPLKAYQSVHCAWPPIPTTPESVIPSSYGTDPKHGATKARKGDSSPRWNYSLQQLEQLQRLLHHVMT